MELADGVYSYALEWQYDEPLRVHVLEVDGTLLFGGGAEETGGRLVEIATEHGIDAVVVEHGDGDHYGGVPALREAVDFEVAVPAGDVEFLREAGIEPDRSLSPGEAYRGVEPIAAPGHTPDNMAYLAGGTLVAGDTVAGADSAFAAEGDWTGPLAAMRADLSDDDDLARESIPNLLEYDFERVLVTHGSNLTADARAAVETLVEDL